MPNYPQIPTLDSCVLTPLNFNQNELDSSFYATNSPTKDSLKYNHPSQIFGTDASFNHNTTQLSTTSHLNISENWQPASVILILICLFCFTIYRYANTIRIIAKNIWSIEATLNILENPSRELYHFIIFSKIMLTIALATITTAIITNLNPQLSPQFLLITIAIITALIVIFAIQNMINRTCGSVCDSQSTFYNIRQLANLNAATAAYIITPTTIIAALNPSCFIWASIPLALLALFHIFRVFIYLKYEKFSFLQWFLYLCTVDLFPVTIPILLLTLFPL